MIFSTVKILQIIPFVFLFSITSLDAQNWEETMKMVASDRSAEDQFGYSVSLSENYAIIGAYLEDENANGSNTMSNSGSAYILERNTNGKWVHKQKLVSSDRTAEDYFGRSVYISGNYAIVGAQQESEDENENNTKPRAGSVYIFERDESGIWIEKQKLVASDRGEYDYFGSSVCISGSYAIVGAHQEDEDTLGLNTKYSAGSVYIFERDLTGTWAEIQKIVASDRNTDDYFGKSVSIQGEYILVGAYGESHDTNGVNEMVQSGSVYYFRRSETGKWIERQKLVASDRNTGDVFGRSISISGIHAIIGASLEDEDANNENTLINSGSAYIFELNLDGIWEEKQKLVSNDRNSNDNFGENVSLSGNLAIVCASYEDEDESGNNFMNESGSAYVFHLNESGVWTEIKKLTASDRDSDDNYGSSADISGNIVFIGANMEDENANGDSSLTNSGSTYIYRYCTNTNSNLKVFACDSFQSPSGKIWTSSGIYNDTLANSAGCDSIITINLTVRSSSYSEYSASVCKNYTSPSGKLWTNSGIYYDTIPNSAGCDSIVTINLSIITSTSSISATSCSDYLSPSGKIWNETGIYKDTVLSSAGCDSVITVNLTIERTSSSFSKTTCLNYTAPSGKVLTTTGIHYDTIPNHNGCDSVITIYLNLRTLLAGDKNCNGKIDSPDEIAGDLNNNGYIDNEETAGDINGDGIITGNETAGDTDGNGYISSGESAGDINGDGSINGIEIAGDTDGDGIIDDGEVEGDIDGNGYLDKDEISSINFTDNEINIIIYPIPVTDKLSIRLNQYVKYVKIELITLNGGTLISNTFTNEKVFKIDTQEIPGGIYILRIYSPDYIVYKRVLFQ